MADRNEELLSDYKRGERPGKRLRKAREDEVEEAESAWNDYKIEVKRADRRTRREPEGKVLKDRRKRANQYGYEYSLTKIRPADRRLFYNFVREWSTAGKLREISRNYNPYNDPPSTAAAFMGGPKDDFRQAMVAIGRKNDWFCDINVRTCLMNAHCAFITLERPRPDGSWATPRVPSCFDKEYLGWVWSIMHALHYRLSPNTEQQSYTKLNNMLFGTGTRTHEERGRWPLTGAQRKTYSVKAGLLTAKELKWAQAYRSHLDVMRVDDSTADLLRKEAYSTRLRRQTNQQTVSDIHILNIIHALRPPLAVEPYIAGYDWRDACVFVALTCGSRLIEILRVSSFGRVQEGAFGQLGDVDVKTEGITLGRSDAAVAMAGYQMPLGGGEEKKGEWHLTEDSEGEPVMTRPQMDETLPSTDDTGDVALDSSLRDLTPEEREEYGKLAPSLKYRLDKWVYILRVAKKRVGLPGEPPKELVKPIVGEVTITEVLRAVRHVRHFFKHMYRSSLTPKPYAWNNWATSNPKMSGYASKRLVDWLTAPNERLSAVVGERTPLFRWADDGEGSPWHFKDLRAIYATLAFETVAPQRMSKIVFFSKVLGHEEGQLTTALSYDTFRIGTSLKITDTDFIESIKGIAERVQAQSREVNEAEERIQRLLTEARAGGALPRRTHTVTYDGAATERPERLKETKGTTHSAQTDLAFMTQFIEERIALEGLLPGYRPKTADFRAIFNLGPRTSALMKTMADPDTRPLLAARFGKDEDWWLAWQPRKRATKAEMAARGDRLPDSWYEEAAAKVVGTSVTDFKKNILPKWEADWEGRLEDLDFNAYGVALERIIQDGFHKGRFENDYERPRDFIIAIPPENTLKMWLMVREILRTDMGVESPTF